MAVRRLLHGKGAFWGGAIGRNPTVRGIAGSKKSILVDGAGGPLSVVVAGVRLKLGLAPYRSRPLHLRRTAT